MDIKVLVVDDSVVVRRSVVACVDRQEGMSVVGTASNGWRGLERIEQTSPDVVVLDIEMPDLDGLATLKHLRARWPRLPVIMYSTLTDSGATATIEALSRGASDYATKPSGLGDRGAVTTHIENTLVPLIRLWAGRGATTSSAAATSVSSAPGASARRPRQVATVELVVIGCSTGGPDALAKLVPALPATLAVPVVIVQHMPPVFTSMLAQRLDRLSPLKVSEGVHGEPVERGHVYIAPGGRHTAVRGSLSALVLEMNDDPAENSVRPAVDVLFRAAAGVGRGAVLATVLTGMGQDGLVGTRAIRAAGGTVYAQDEASSVVWGMPGFVAREGLADAVLALRDIAGAITTAVSGRVRAGVGR